MLYRSFSLLLAVVFVFARSSTDDSHAPALEEFLSEVDNDWNSGGQLNAEEVRRSWRDGSNAKSYADEEVMAKALQVLEKEEAVLDLEFEKMGLEIKVLNEELGNPEETTTQKSNPNSNQLNNLNIETGQPKEDNKTKNNTTIDKTAGSEFLIAGGARVDRTFGSVLICSVLALLYFGRQ